jgi:small-conductance mechanosensitive channel
MAKRAMKVTGFTRFFLVMIIVAPLAYIAASYYNGQDGVQNFKNFLGIGEKQEVTESAAEPDKETRIVNQSPTANALEDENKKLKEELDFKTRRVEELFKENEELRRKLESLERALQEAERK